MEYELYATRRQTRHLSAHLLRHDRTAGARCHGQGTAPRSDPHRDQAPGRSFDQSGQLRDCEFMDAKMIAIGCDKHLCLVPQAPKGNRVNDAITVALKRGPWTASLQGLPDVAVPCWRPDRLRRALSPSFCCNFGHNLTRVARKGRPLQSSLVQGVHHRASLCLALERADQQAVGCLERHRGRILAFLNTAGDFSFNFFQVPGRPASLAPVAT